MSELALQLIAKAKEERLTTLDLGNCGLTSLPEELFELVWLEELYLCNDRNNRDDIIIFSEGSRNHLSKIPKGMQRLKCLRKLDLSGSFLGWWSIKKIENLNGLENLELLDISYNNISCLENLESLKKLRELIIWRNRISDIENLDELENLENLDLESNQIRDIKNLDRLRKLKCLNISWNQIKNIENLNSLISLERLYISGNPIKCIENLDQLVNLRVLYIYTTQEISCIKNLDQLVNLEKLDISFNPIKRIENLDQLINLKELTIINTEINSLENLDSLKGLKKLNISSNNTKDLTDLENLISLECLNFNWNKISHFPKKVLTQLTQLKELYLYDNPIKNIPPALYNIDFDFNALPHLQNYFAREKEWIANRQCKIILIGNGCVGKTTLAKRLIENPDTAIHIPIEERTHGIVVENWTVEEVKPPLEIRLWDFAGQAIFHASHRHFLSENTLYLLLYADHPPEDPQDDSPKHNPSYWLDYIAYWGKGSSVILVKNIFQEGESEIIDKEWIELMEKYEQNNLLQFGTPQIINAQIPNNQYKRVALIQEILDKAEKIVTKNLQLPVSWIKVRTKLNELKDHLINYDTYLKIGAKCRLTPHEMKTILLHLHNSGDIFYKQGLFNDQIILDLDWIIKGVYNILKSTKIKELHQKETYIEQYFTFDDLQALFEDKSIEEVDLYLNFMESCELVFKKRHPKVGIEYVAPRLLPANPPKNSRYYFELAQQNKPSSFYYLRIHYPFLHASIIEQFIVAVASRLKSCFCWRNGLSFTDDIKRKNSAWVEVQSPKSQSTRDQQYIEILTEGTNKGLLLANIRQTFQKIRHFSDVVEEQISIDGENWESIDDLKAANQNKSISKALQELLEIFKLIEQGQLSNNWLHSLEIIAEQQQKNKLKQIVIAYNQRDEMFFQNFQETLVGLKNILLTKGIELNIWDISQIRTGETKSEQINNKWGQADYVLCLISSSFLANEYQKSYFQKAIKRNQDAQDDFCLVPIIIRSCMWEEYPDLKAIQVLPKELYLEDIDEWNNKAKFWKYIGKELLGLLQK